MTMMITEVPARARVNYGRWIADCTRPYCANAELVSPDQEQFCCSNCKLIAPLEWPDRADEITEVLWKRPVPETRNWYPAGHPEAVKLGLPHGQSPGQLMDENREHGVI